MKEEAAQKIRTKQAKAEAKAKAVPKKRGRPAKQVSKDNPKTMEKEDQMKTNHDGSTEMKATEMEEDHHDGSTEMKANGPKETKAKRGARGTKRTVDEATDHQAKGELANGDDSKDPQPKAARAKRSRGVKSSPNIMKNVKPRMTPKKKASPKRKGAKAVPGSQPPVAAAAGDESKGGPPVPMRSDKRLEKALQGLVEIEQTGIGDLQPGPGFDGKPLA